MPRSHPTERSASPSRRQNRGFTLVEILIAITIFGMVIVAIGMVLRTAVRSWNVGHDIDEIVQTARITQDVLTRDMNNMVYLRQQSYNRTFQGELFQAANLYEQDYLERGGMIELDDRYEFETITPPIDLSFRAGSGRLTFVRSHQPRFEGDPLTWGVRRLTYYVEDNTLYRKESDPFGYRPGQLDESFYNASATAAALAEHFMKADGYDFLMPEGEILDALPPELRLLSGEYEVAEPLCEGVDSFEISCGFFKEGKWQEVEGWDSSARQNRKPPRIQSLDDENQIEHIRRTMPQFLLEIDGVPTVLQDRGQPDDLPGYIVVNLGVRGPRGVGRVHKFTFFHAIPLAEERDVLLLTEEEREAGYLPPIDLNTERFHRER